MKRILARSGGDPPRIDSIVCLHSGGCSMCVAACPHQAIRPDRESVPAIDGSVCERCGICAIVCPANAISFSRRASLRFREAGSVAPPAPRILLFDPDGEPFLAAGSRPAIPCLALGHAAELRFSHLLYLFYLGFESAGILHGYIHEGLARFIALLAADLKKVTGGRMDLQVFPLSEAETAKRLRAWAGDGPPRGDEQQAFPSRVAQDGAPAATSPRFGRHRSPWSTRNLPPQADVRLAAPHPDSAYDVLDALGGSLRAPICDLRTAFLGDVEIGATCSSCGACIGACPAGALQIVPPGGIALRAGCCTACGLCVERCPEGAIAVHRRYDPSFRGERVLFQHQTASCTSCGAPFASRTLIEALRERMKAAGATNAMLESLGRCPACKFG